jgi:hypothetical protein
MTVGSLAHSFQPKRGREKNTCPMMAPPAWPGSSNVRQVLLVSAEFARSVLRAHKPRFTAMGVKTVLRAFTILATRLDACSACKAPHPTRLEETRAARRSALLAISRTRRCSTWVDRAALRWTRYTQTLGGWPANSDHKNVHLDPRLTALRQDARRAIVSQKTLETTTARQDFGACHVLPASSRVLTAPAVMTVMLGRTASWEFALRVTRAKRRVADSLAASTVPRDRSQIPPKQAV